jgi:hypothetical protein
LLIVVAPVTFLFLEEVSDFDECLSIVFGLIKGFECLETVLDLCLDLFPLKFIVLEY